MVCSGTKLLRALYFGSFGSNIGFPSSNELTADGDIHFDIDEAWDLADSGFGVNLFRVLTHETGHAIGLAHEHNITALMNPFYSEEMPLGLLADDVAGAQQLYGKPYADGISDVTPVPEPTTILIFTLGLVGLVGLKTRERTRNS